MSIFILNKHETSLSVPIYTSELDIIDDERKLFIEEAYKVGGKQSFKTNLKGIMSSYRVWNQTNLYNNLLSKIKKICQKAANLSLNHIDAWVGIYKKGHYAISHSHYPSLVTFVYYLQVDDNNPTPLIFTDNNFTFTPSTNSLIIFPGYMYHFVPEHKSNIDRIVISGNFDGKK